MGYRTSFDETAFIEDVARGAMSVAALARRHGISPRHAARLLAGRNRPHIAKRISLRRALPDTCRDRLIELRDAAVRTLKAALKPRRTPPPAEGQSAGPPAEAPPAAPPARRTGRRPPTAAGAAMAWPDREAVHTATDVLNHLLGERWLSEPAGAPTGREESNPWLDRLSPKTRQTVLRKLRARRRAGAAPEAEAGGR